MIYDTLDNASAYPFGPAFDAAVRFVCSLSADTPAGRQEIDGDTVYANVMEYDMAEGGPETYEAHRRYADLQAALAGNEALRVCSADFMRVKIPYDEGRDCAFLSPDVAACPVRLHLFPGNFALLLPQDAHVGGEVSRPGGRHVKKVVVKIALDRLCQSGRIGCGGA